MLKIVCGEAKIARGRFDDGAEKYEAIVRDIVRDVRENGDAAVLAYTRKFDCPDIERLRVSDEEIAGARARADGAFLETLAVAKENIEFFHKSQLRSGFDLVKPGGVRLGQLILPLESVGAYVPGGTAAYPSSVLMTLIPAKIAGVSRVCMITPPGRDGAIKDEILLAADACGVREIYKCGGAQAVAALAYGTQSIPAVDKIVGPGNIFVTLAKKQLFGRVGIDMTAGPSEIMILADGASNPAHVAADMLSQAEHDKLASAILVTDSKALAEAVSAEIERQLPLLPRRDIARASIDDNARAYVVKNLEEAVSLVNGYAPEHLEICVDEPFQYLPGIRAAGSIFLGRYTPEPLADYLAGPNHVLPTGGSARFFSPLSVDDFVKRTSYLYYPEGAEAEIAPRVAMFARLEGLEAHARSALIRRGEAEA